MALPLALPAAKRTRPVILTASATQLEPRDQTTRRRLSQGWQKQALEMVDIVPELSFASRFYARMLKKVNIFPATRDSNNNLKPITSGPPVDLLERIQDPGGGRSQILGAYGRLMFITGEGYLFGHHLNTDRERWAFVSVDELDMNDHGEIVWKPLGSTNSSAQVFPINQAVAYRFWTPHPAFSGQADSPMRSTLDIAEELVILTKAVRATAVSRMLNGMIKVPSELSFGSDEPGVDDDPEANPFLASLIDHIVGVIESAGTAEAASPFIAEGANEFLAALEWVKMHDPATDYMERDLRKEATHRLALGLDMPPESLLGLATANHWNGRQIILEQWRSHGSSVAEQFADDLAEAYLRPALQDASYEDWQKVVIGIDDSKVVTNPDRTTDANEAFDRLGISWPGLRQLKGISEDLAPTEEEMRLMLAMKLRDPSLLQGTKYESTITPPERGPMPDAVNGKPAEEGPPTPNPRTGVSRSESSQTHAVRGAAELALLRCHEVAGARVRSQLKGEMCESVNGHHNGVICSLLGQERVQSVTNASPLQLVSGGTDSFTSLLQGWGYTKAQSESLSEMLMVYASRTLFEQRAPDLPSGFTAQIERMKEVAGELA